MASPVGVALLRREEAERVVAPVIAQAAVEQIAVVEKDMDRQELDGGDAEPAQMLDHAAARPARDSCRASRAQRRIARWVRPLTWAS